MTWTRTRPGVRWRVVALIAILGTLSIGGPAQAQDRSPVPAVDLCVVTLDELNGITGLAFERMASGAVNCAYEGGPDDAPYLLDLHLEDPGYGFQVLEKPEDRMAGYPFTLGDGESRSLGDRLAWLGAHGLAVDMGGQVLVIQPVLVFAADPPDPGTFLVPVAELAVRACRRSSPPSPRRRSRWATSHPPPRVRAPDDHPPGRGRPARGGYSRPGTDAEQRRLAAGRLDPRRRGQ